MVATASSESEPSCPEREVVHGPCACHAIAVACGTHGDGVDAADTPGTVRGGVIVKEAALKWPKANFNRRAPLVGGRV
jgi:hypothetical protein